MLIFPHKIGKHPNGLCDSCNKPETFLLIILRAKLELELESGYLTTLHSCDGCQRRVPISCVRRQASDPWLTLTTVGESGDGALPEPLPGVESSVMCSRSSVGRRYS